MWCLARARLHPRHWICSRLHERIARAAQAELLSPTLRTELCSDDVHVASAAMRRHRVSLLTHIAHLYPLLCAALALTSQNDRLVGALHSRLGHALHAAATDGAIAMAVAESECDATDGMAAKRSWEIANASSDSCYCRWQGGKPSAAVKHIQAQAVAHERRALVIMREYYGQAGHDLLYYDLVRQSESF
jgi:hypothetical protein